MISQPSALKRPRINISTPPCSMLAEGSIPERLSFPSAVIKPEKALLP